MKKFRVHVPMVGYISFDIIAEDESEAVRKALAEDWYMDDVQELNLCKELIHSDICNARYTKAVAEFVETIDWE